MKPADDPLCVPFRALVLRAVIELDGEMEPIGYAEFDEAVGMPSLHWSPYVNEAARDVFRKVFMLWSVFGDRDEAPDPWEFLADGEQRPAFYVAPSLWFADEGRPQ